MEEADKLPWYKIPPFTKTGNRVVVIGAGIAGISAAYSFAKRGWQVELIERNEDICQEASGNISGILMPLITSKKDPLGKFFYSGFKYIIKNIENLVANGSNISWDKSGVIELTPSKVQKDIHDLVIDSHDIKKISAQQIGNYTDMPLKVGNGLYFQNGGWLNPLSLCNSYLKLYKDNIKITKNREAVSLLKNNKLWHLLNSKNEIIISSEIVVIANAIDAKSFEQCSWLPLTPVKGQVNYLSELPYNIKTIFSYGGYIMPSIDGFHCLGATFQRGINNKNIDEDGCIENISNFKNYFDVDIGQYSPLGGRAAVRAVSVDRRPIVGAVPDRKQFLDDYKDLCFGRNKVYPDGKYIDGLYISVGHGSRGLVSAPLSGEILASMVEGKILPVDEELIDLLNPARFIIRDLCRKSV